MNFLQRWILGKDLVSKLELKGVPPPARFSYRIENGRIVTPVDNKLAYIQDGYNKNDIIFSVVNMVLDKVRLPEWGLYKVVKESPLKKYHSMMSNKFLTTKDLKRALELKYD